MTHLTFGSFSPTLRLCSSSTGFISAMLTRLSRKMKKSSSRKNTAVGITVIGVT